MDWQQAHVEAAERERCGDAADAERYRWLRGGKARTTGLPREGRVEVMRWDDRSEGSILKGEALDAAVDAAMQRRHP